ncbi:MAG TPA: phenylalanine--tRNA ligase subunit beta [Euryarchaeota archaeon]|nr:phenylalanine--tRNA ligase subunit beta [Euryarchaeota archaeon]
MPVIELSVKELNALIGEEIGVERLVSSITKMGADVESADEKTITVEFFPDRPDLLSVEGTARALRSFLRITPGLQTYSLNPATAEVTVDPSILPIRRYIECLVVKEVRLNEDLLKGLMEIQEDLHWALGRDRKKVAIGVHDSAKITPPYTYRAAAPEEIGFEPLGMPGQEMSLSRILEKHPKGVEYAGIISGFDKYPVILDSKGNVLSMPPIINGELTKLTVDTTDIFVEMTGTDARAVRYAMNILTAAFAEHKWTLSTVTVKYPDKNVITPNLKPIERRLSVDYTNRMLGLNLTPEEVKLCLEKTGYGAVKEGDGLRVSVPAYRSDILHDIDLVEDVAIGYGYDRFETELPALSTTGRRLPAESVVRKARRAMLGLGFTEVMTLMLTNEAVNNERMCTCDSAVKVQNPISIEHTIIRTHLLPSLLEVLYINRHRELPQRIFEAGDVLKLDPDVETGARSVWRLAGVVVHGKANFSEIKSIFNAVLRDLSIEGKIESFEHPSFIPGRCAQVVGVGYFGELHPQVLTNFGLEYPAVAFEITLK